MLPHGGYKKLIVYRKSDVIYQGTVVFCRRFLPAHGDRTVDQMTQAARSCKQNIAEGSAASGTSKETEIKLTNVARATLDELIEDYLDWLKSHGFAEWPSDDERRIAARDYAKAHADWADWQKFFETRPADTAANLMLTICHQTRYMLDKMIAAQEEDFKKHGGVRERMHAARTAARGEGRVGQKRVFPARCRCRCCGTCRPSQRNQAQGRPVGVEHQAAKGLAMTRRAGLTGQPGPAGRTGRTGQPGPAFAEDTAALCVATGVRESLGSLVCPGSPVLKEIV